MTKFVNNYSFGKNKAIIDQPKLSNFVELPINRDIPVFCILVVFVITLSVLFGVDKKPKVVQLVPFALLLELSTSFSPWIKCHW